MDFELPEELKMIQGLVKRFVQEELLPIEKEVEDKSEFLESVRLALRKKAKDLGLWAICGPQECGGSGMGSIAKMVVVEELGKVSIPVGYHGGVIGPRGDLGTNPYYKYANAEQKKKYMAPVMTGEIDMFSAITEPNAGSDTGNMQTRAVKNGDYYILNGTKMFITGVGISDFGCICAVTDWEKRRKGGVTCFIVEKKTPGFSYRAIPLMGRRGLQVFELSFSDCAVPASNVLGDMGRGLDIALEGVFSARVGCSAAMLGSAQRALDMAKAYAKQRVTFGKPLAERQMIQEMIIDSENEVYAARLMLFDLAWRHDRGEDVSTRMMMVKPHVCEMALRVIDKAIQIHGGYGYSKELPLEMMYRDARLYTIADGGSQVLRWAAARRLLKD